MNKNYIVVLWLSSHNLLRQSPPRGIALFAIIWLLLSPMVGNAAVLTVGISGSGATYTRIQTAYSAAVAGDTIRIIPANSSIAGSGFLASGTNPFLWDATKSIVLDGNGCTIYNTSASNTYQAIRHTAGNMHIINLKLCQFSGTDGSAIGDYYAAGITNTLINVTVTRSFNNSYAVWLENSTTITDCNFSNQMGGTNTGGLHLVNAEGNTQKIYTVTNSTFNCNFQNGNGAGVKISDESGGNHVKTSTYTFTGCSFSNNACGSNQGAGLAIVATGTATLDNCVFAGNTSSGTTGTVAGGAIYVAAASTSSGNFMAFNLQNSLVDNNVCGKNCIAIASGTSTVSNCLVRGNTGAAAPIVPNSTVTNCVFEANGTMTVPSSGSSVFVNNSPATQGNTPIFNYPGYIKVTCSDGTCGNAITGGYATGATITAPCATQGGTLTSTTTGQWYYQQGTTVTAIAGATGTSATIPAITGYAIFFQDVASGTDPMVSMTVTAASTAAAGDNQALSAPSSTTLAANNPSPSTGVWSIVSGPNTSTAQFSNTSAYNSTFTPTASGTYTLRWTVGTVGCSTFDDVVITVAALSITGTVFNDANGYTNSLIDGVAYSLENLTAVLYNQFTSAVVAFVSVDEFGVYTFNGVPNGTYSVILISNADVVDVVIGGGAPNPSLASNLWANTAEGTGTLSDGTANGIIENIMVNGASVSDKNFGINQIPTATPLTVSTDQTNPGGSSQVQVPTLTGTDPEDGSYTGGNSLRIVTLPDASTQGVLYYNGVAVTAGQLITNYNPALLTIDPVDSGPVLVTFTFSQIDAAGMESPAAAVEIPFGTALPITLKSFEVIKQGTSSLLQWVTATEINNQRFDIERSGDDLQWKLIGTIDSKYHNSSVDVSYSFVDRTPLQGNNYYRLRQIDFDGKTSLSQVRILRFQSNNAELILSPNPANNRLSIQAGDQVAQIDIIDANGRAVQTILGAETLYYDNIDLSAHQAGYYTVIVKYHDGSILTSRFVKQ